MSSKRATFSGGIIPSELFMLEICWKDNAIFIDHNHYMFKPFFTFLHTSEVSPQKKNNKIWTASGLLNPLKMQLGSFHNFYCCRIICISVVFVRQQTNTKDKGEVNLLDGPGCSLLSYCFLHRGCSHFDPPHRSLLPTCCTAIWCLTIYNSNL